MAVSFERWEGEADVSRRRDVKFYAILEEGKENVLKSVAQALREGNWSEFV